ncbi:unnamed protein product [Chironomus riparius]|uniref:Uncharacterized protein n=1 Tax=Chironomus riparius TaxID=315576 RepID=A0A9N9RIP2_9DIPT|nr:unnamed protein product [Chironomus riparius]
MSNAIVYVVLVIATSFGLVITHFIIALRREANQRARQLSPTNPTISSSYTYDTSTQVHSQHSNAINPSASAVSTIYSGNFARQNNELPSYTEIFNDDLPTYHQVVHENTNNTRN